MRLISAALAISIGGVSIYRGLIESSTANIVVACIGCLLFAVVTWLGGRLFPGKFAPDWAVAIFAGLVAVSASVIESSGPFAYFMFGVFLCSAGVVLLLRLFAPNLNILGTNPKNYEYGSNFFLDALSSPTDHLTKSSEKRKRN
jgi:hypothetical protein